MPVLLAAAATLKAMLVLSLSPLGIRWRMLERLQVYIGVGELLKFVCIAAHLMSFQG